MGMNTAGQCRHLFHGHQEVALVDEHTHGLYNDETRFVVGPVPTASPAMARFLEWKPERDENLG